MGMKQWYEKAKGDGRKAYLDGVARDDVPKRRGREGRYFWQEGWDEAKAEDEAKKVKAKDR